MGSSGSLCSAVSHCGGAPRCAHDCGFPDCSKHAHPQGSNARTTSLRLARWRFAFISASTTVWQSCGSFEPPRGVNRNATRYPLLVPIRLSAK